MDQETAEFARFDLKNDSSALTLRFSQDAFDGIRLGIGAGFISIPRRGAEVGGILIGEVTKEASGWTLVINSIIPVPIQYQYGPSFRLSNIDRQHFLEAAQHPPHGSTAVGWYRSNTRPNREPDDADRLMTRTFFADGNRVFLFCEPSGDGRISATCILSPPEGPEIAFPFELGRFSKLELMLSGEPAECMRHSPEPAATLAAMPPTRAEMALRAPGVRMRPMPVASKAPWWRVFTGAAARPLLALAIVAGIFYYVRGRAFSAPSPTVSASSDRAVDRSAPTRTTAPSLGLSAEYQGSSLRIGWNRASPEVGSAAAATFTIADGFRSRVLKLSAKELQYGSIVYKPSADEIRVEMNVTSASGSAATQSIRIIGPWGAPSNVPVAKRAARVVTPILEQLVPARGAPAAPRFERPAVRTPAAQPRSITAPDAPAIDANLAVTVNPALSVDPGIGANPAANGSPAINVSPAVNGRPAVNVSKAASQDASEGRVLASGPASTALRSPPPAPPPATNPAAAPNKFHAAVPIHSPQPPLPAGAVLPDYVFDRNVQVQVEVSIDTSGRVTAARLTGEAGPYSTLLGPPALNTARMWIFRPATLDERPVESRMVLTFHYSRRR